MAFTLKDMQKFAAEAWGPFGLTVVECWVEFNQLYFRGKLKPVPLVITNAQPYGKRLAFCSYNPGTHGRTITINVPTYRGKAAPASYRLLADNGVLLHEMVHQFLFERGESAKHDSEGWRREIMRITKAIDGRDIWAGKYTTKRVEGVDGKLSKVIRINAAREDGTESLGQDDIARWPHTVGIDLGHLGHCNV
jgi:hypothetical protein